MTSKRNQVVEAVVALVVAASPGAKVSRNQDKPDRVDEAGGLLIVRDGDPGEPVGVDLGPPTYHYAHRIPLELAPFSGGDLSSAEKLDAMMTPIGAAVLADRSLGGLVDFLEVEAPALDDLEALGAPPLMWADAAVVAHYATRDPMG